MSLRFCVFMLVLMGMGASVATAQIAPPPKEQPAQEPTTPAALVRLPEVVKFVEAAYPQAALDESVEADVRLQIEIDIVGKVTKAVVIEPVGYGFDEAAVAAVSQMEFSPAMTESGAVPVQIEYVYRFTIQTETTPVEVDPPASPEPMVVKLRGRLLELGTRSPIAGVTILVPAVGKSALSGTDGRFELMDLPPGPTTLVIPPTQYEQSELVVPIPDDGAAEVTIRLKRDPFSEFRTVIEGQKELPEPVKRKLVVQEIQKIPGVSGDALKAVQNLPGVARPPGAAGLLVVRGANPGDTAIRVDEAVLPQLYHFGGVYSVFNTDLLESIDFYPGGFSVKQGDATAGLVSVSLKEGRTDRWGGYFDINVFHAAGFASGPTWEDGSLTLAARRSYIDAIVPLVVPDDMNLSFTTAPVYYDYQAQLDQRLGPKDRLRIFVYGSDDQLRILLKEPSATNPAIRDRIENHSYFHTIQAQWEHVFSNDFKLVSRLQFGAQLLSFYLGDTISFKLEPILRGGWREDFSWKVADFFTLDFGLDVGYEYATADITAPLQPREGESPPPLTTATLQSVNESATFGRRSIYVEGTVKPVESLSLTSGLRVDWWGGVWKRWTIDPRASFRWNIVEGTVLKGGLGVYHKRPQFGEVIEPFGNPELDAEEATQYALGIEQTIVEGLSIGVEGFYKDLRNLVSSVQNRDNDDPPIENGGEGRAYGAELLLRQRLGGWYWGWVAYTLSFAERKDPASGGYRPFDFDQTHILTVVASFTLPWELSLGGRFRYVTGSPDTPVVGAVYDGDSGIYVPAYGEPNSDRNDDFHQLDVRLDKTWTFEDWILTTYIEVQNVYNRANPEGYSYNYNYTDRQVISGLPIIPGFGIKGEF